MNHRTLFIASLVALAICASVMIVDAQGPRPGGQKSPAAVSTGTGFTYQGQVKQSGALINGSCDFVFNLWDSSSSGNQIGTNITQSVPVTNGLFTTALDFGSDKFIYDARWLAASVRCPAGGGGYTALTPRQKLTPAPFALALPGFYTQQNPNSPNIIGGHVSNTITAGVFGATIGGGGTNGEGNRVTDHYSTIGGGYGNQAGDNAGFIYDAELATVGGGQGNIASGVHSTVGGGFQNIAAGDKATVPGGYQNQANQAQSFAAGTQAIANHTGAFVWSDSQFTNFTSTANNQFLVRAGGGVGLGTNAPATQLHVVKSANGSGTNPADNVAVFENTNTNNSADVLALKIGGTGDPAGSNNFITFLKGDNSSVGSIEGNGTGSVVLAGAGNDYAEYLPRANVNETLNPGDIVGVNGGRVSRTTRGATQYMVVSNRAIVAGNDPGESERRRFALIAFIGQAPAHVRGAVRAGDFIIPSGLDDGTGIAVSPEAITTEQLAQVVGQSWESSDQLGIKNVNVAVGLTRHDPTVQRLMARIVNLESQNANFEARLAALELANGFRNESNAPDWRVGILLMGVLGVVVIEHARKAAR